MEAVNTLFLETFGWEAEEILGRRYDGFVRESDQRSFRELLSIMAYGGSREPQEVSFVADGDGGGGTEVSLVGVPNVLEDPTAAVAILCRPRGKPMGKPVGPPKIWKADSGDGPDRDLPRQRAKEDRRMNETSRHLWD